MRCPFDSDLLLFHRFQQCTLGSWRSAVDFVSQNQLGKDRTGMKLKRPLSRS